MISLQNQEKEIWLSQDWLLETPDQDDFSLGLFMFMPQTLLPVQWMFMLYAIVIYLYSFFQYIVVNILMLDTMGGL